MPVLLDAEQLVVTAAPGAASTALLAAALAIPAARQVPAGDVESEGHQLVDAKHSTMANLIAHGLVEPDHGLRIVTSTRNPFAYYPAEWERARTRWLRDARAPDSWVRRQAGALERAIDAATMTFDEWLLHVLGDARRRGERRHLNPGHVAEADVVVRCEHLDDDLAAAGLAFPPVPSRNVGAPRPPYWTYYSDDGRRAVAEVHRPDLDRFGYLF